MCCTWQVQLQYKIKKNFPICHFATLDLSLPNHSLDLWLLATLCRVCLASLSSSSFHFRPNEQKPKQPIVGFSGNLNGICSLKFKDKTFPFSSCLHPLKILMHALTPLNWKLAIVFIGTNYHNSSSDILCFNDNNNNMIIVKDDWLYSPWFCKLHIIKITLQMYTFSISSLSEYYLQQLKVLENRDHVVATCRASV